jgi:hypothetical protein
MRVFISKHLQEYEKKLFDFRGRNHPLLTRTAGVTCCLSTPVLNHTNPPPGDSVFEHRVQLSLPEPLAPICGSKLPEQHVAQLGNKSHDRIANSPLPERSGMAQKTHGPTTQYLVQQICTRQWQMNGSHKAALPSCPHPV